MPSSFRPTSVQDLEPLRGFLAQAFQVPLDAPFLDPDLMRWKYWAARGDWLEPRSFVLEREGVIVSHAGVWPVTLTDGESVARGIQMIDWAAAKGSAGAGVALLRWLAEMVDFIYSIGGSEATRKVLPALGFLEYAQQWKAVRPLRPIRQVLTHQERNWKLGPRLLRNWSWANRGSRVALGGWRAEPISPSETSTPALPPGSPTEVAIPRPPAFFKYLSRCPTVPIRTYRILDGEQPKGHFALSLVRGQARVVGLWPEEPDVHTTALAWELARRHALQLSGANELVITGSDSWPGQEAAVAADFRVSRGPTVYMLDAGGSLAPFPRLQFQFADGDGAFLDDGAVSYWS